MLSCLGFSASAYAQTTPVSADEAATERPAKDIVVTGSRIRRAAADSPSPLAVVDADQIKATGTQNIADVVNQLPALAVTQTNQTSNLAGNAGVNALDLRGMGTQRTLVLVDGRRQVAAIPGTSAVDLSNIPSSLVQRVEVITGGASALYGADAVAGVANFILKKDFQGIEANTRYNASTRGDMDTYGFDLLAGTNFADHRGNVTVYGFYENTPGTVSGSDRPWTADGYPIYARTSSSSPYFIQDHVRNINTADAAQVVLGGRLYSVNRDSGTLRDPILGPGGLINVVPVNLGTSTDPLGTLLTDGGEYNGRYDGWYLSVPSERFNTRASASFEVSDALKLFANATFAHNTSKAGFLQMTAFGTDVVPADSPFITDEMRAANGGAVPAGGVQFARRFMELPAPRTEYDRKLFQAVAGAEGDFTLFAQPWNYSTYYTYGKTTQRVRDVNSTAYDRWYMGIDSTTGANGEAVCRSTLDDPGNGCVAINPLVTLTPEMIDYITYTSHWSKSTLTQQVLSGYVSGGLFDLPGGAVQVVLGGEYRKERNDIGAIPEYNPDSPLYDPTIGTMQGTLVGKYSVKEVYGEIHVPILKDTPFFDTLCLAPVGLQHRWLDHDVEVRRRMGADPRYPLPCHLRPGRPRAEHRRTLHGGQHFGPLDHRSVQYLQSRQPRDPHAVHGSQLRGDQPGRYRQLLALPRHHFERQSRPEAGNRQDPDARRRVATTLRARTVAHGRLLQHRLAQRDRRLRRADADRQVRGPVLTGQHLLPPHPA
jgi:outer membrane receptor protein involved in Fe transport